MVGAVLIFACVNWVEGIKGMRTKQRDITDSESFLCDRMMNQQKVLRKTVSIRSGLSAVMSYSMVFSVAVSVTWLRTLQSVRQ